MNDLAVSKQTALLLQHCMHRGKPFKKILQKWSNTFLDSLLSPSAHKVLLLLMLKESAKYR